MYLIENDIVINLKSRIPRSSEKKEKPYEKFLV